MSKLRDHFIICGAGRVGSHLIRSLRAADGMFLVIESDQRKCEALMDLGVPVLVRDATLEESLAKPESNMRVDSPLVFPMMPITFT